jgi:hypothetical protein
MFSAERFTPVVTFLTAQLRSEAASSCRQGLSKLLQLAEQDVLRDLESGMAALEDSIESQNAVRLRASIEKLHEIFRCKISQRALDVPFSHSCSEPPDQQGNRGNRPAEETTGLQ